MFMQMNDLLVNDVVVIPLVRQADISGVSNTLEGVTLTPWDADLWRDQRLETETAMKTGWLNNLKIGRKLTIGFGNSCPC